MKMIIKYLFMGCAILAVVLVLASVVVFFVGAKIVKSIPEGFFSTGPNGFGGRGYSGPEYRVKGDKVFHRTTVMEGADAKTFTPIVPDNPNTPTIYYGKDAKQVYYEGKRLPGADPATIKDLGWPLALDASHVYYNGSVIEGADPNTFKIINGSVSRYRDKSHVYAREKVIEGADPATYELVGDGRLGRDKKDYYLRNNDDYDNGEFALHVRDMASFKLLIPAVPSPNHNPWEDMWSVIWARDNQCFYVGDKAITIADPATFEHLGQGYAKDAKQVYYLQHVLADADPQTFQLVSPNHDERWAKSFAGYAKDANRVYHHEKVLQDADADTFTVEDEREFKDKNHRYNQGHRVE